MDDAKTPILPLKEEAIKYNMTKIYNLDEKDKQFILKISSNDNLIYFELEKKNLFPKKDFNIHLSLEELGNINKFFKQFEAIPEVLDSFESLIQLKNISVVEEERQMKLKISNPVNNKEFELNIPLKEKDFKSEIRSINEYIISLDNKVNELEKKVNDLCSFKEEYLNRKKEKERKKKEGQGKTKIEEKVAEKKEESNQDKEKENIFKDSEIIQKNEEDIKLISSWINKFSFKTNLLFSSKKRENLFNTFYKNIEKKSPILILIKTTKGYIFGGYFTKPLTNDNKWIKDDSSFIFSLYLKKKYDAILSSNTHIIGNKDLFQFGNDIRIYNEATLRKDNYIGKSDYSSPGNYNMNGGQKYFCLEKLEAYEIV